MEFTDNDSEDEDLLSWKTQDVEVELKRSSRTRSTLQLTQRSTITRNVPISAPFVKLDTFTFHGIPLAERVYVELQDGDFLKIVHIIQDVSTSAVTLRGYRFRRTRELHGVLDRKMNEVCWIMHIDDDDPRDANIQGMETVPVDKAVKRRRIRLTNQSFPALSWRGDGRSERSETIEKDRVLVCRFKYLYFYTDANARAVYNWSEKGFHRLREDECDRRSDNMMKNEELRRIWRGHTVLGGAQAGWLPGEKEYLRQEGVSHRGITSRSSLKASSGPDFPVGDPMKRGTIAPLLTEYDLQLSQGIRQSSIQPYSTRDVSLTVIEIDAHIKTSSSSGTSENHYEGRVTSTYYPTPRLSQKKRPADTFVGPSTRPVKRVYPFWPESSKDSYPHRHYNHANRTSIDRKTSPRPESIVSDTISRPGHGSAEDPQPLPLFSPLYMKARSSMICKPQAERETDDIIDLTRPQAGSHGIFSYARPSMPRQPSGPSPLISLHEAPVLSSNPTSVSRGKRPQPASTPKANQQQRYTFGDCFCGAGGMSRGAVSAGLRVNWGFDFNLAACQSYGMNFFATSVFNVWANQFSEAKKGDRKVDILHMSPPCQFFSDAHTIQGKDDDMNIASLFAIFNLLEKAQPRIVTLEQTSGLIRRHPIFFNAVINMFTSRGFSVRWRIMNCADFGLPQRRMRLFIMASCPGEVLPPFPTPTHSANPGRTGLKPWTTINETIARIPPEWANHDVHIAKERDSPPQSGDKIATCITTGGGGIIHPSGKRDYTLREFASLQGFPLGHKFGPSGVKKQIGNAVPPIVATILLESIKNALLKADGLL